nr:non-likeous end-joining factor 1 [Quercus suber]
MVSVLSWKSLRAEIDGLPPLLVKAELQSSGYNILLTDLGRLWSERLTKLDIIERARSCGSSIDPSQGNDQQEILLTHIGRALRHEDGTKLELCQVLEDSESLSLHLTAPLPGKLPPLRWTVHLHLSPVQIMVDEVVMPLLHKADDLRKQVQYLITEIHNKDRVISKISDRLEVSGNDLTTVFPNVSRVKTSRKRSQREQLAPHIQGLSDFDEVNWRTQMPGVNNSDRFSLDSLDEIVAGLLPRELCNTDTFATDKWWQDLATKPSIATPDGKENHGTEGEQQAIQDDVHMDDLRQQCTSPQLMKQQSTNEKTTPAGQPMAPESPHIAALEDESTEDEDDLDALPPVKNTMKQSPQARAHEAISRTVEPASTANEQRRRSTRSDCLEARSTSPAGWERRSPKMGVVSAKGEVKPGVGHAVSTTWSQQSENDTMEATPVISTKPKARLGVIGGHRRRVSDESVTPAMPTRAKLGVFGGKTGSSIDANASSRIRNDSKAETCGHQSSIEHKEPDVFDDMTTSMENEHSGRTDVKETSPSSRTSLTKRPTPELQETEEERANRKRSQLKTELTEKAKGHVKKKRKF